MSDRSKHQWPLGHRSLGHGCGAGRQPPGDDQGICYWGTAAGGDNRASDANFVCSLFSFFVEMGSRHVALAGSLSTSYGLLQLEIYYLTPHYDKVSSLKQERLVENSSHHLLVYWLRNRVRKAGTDRQRWVKTQTVEDKHSQAIARPAHSSFV